MPTSPLFGIDNASWISVSRMKYGLNANSRRICTENRCVLKQLPVHCQVNEFNVRKHQVTKSGIGGRHAYNHTLWLSLCMRCVIVVILHNS